MSESSRAFLFGLTLTELMILIIFLLALLIGVAERERREVDLRAQEAIEAEALASAGRDAVVGRVAELESRLAELTGSRRREIDLSARLERLERERESEPETIGLVRTLLDSPDTDSAAALEKLLVELERLTRAGEGERVSLADWVESALERSGTHEQLGRCRAELADTGTRLSDANELLLQEREERVSCVARIDYLRRAAGKGASWPPCWPASDPARRGKQDYLFDVDMRGEGYRIAPAWPEARDAEARALPGVMSLVGRTVTPEEFTRATQAIYARSVEANCRHFVHVGDALGNDKTLYKTRLERVERHFYKRLR